jgi:hypothetical protein
MLVKTPPQSTYERIKACSRSSHEVLPTKVKIKGLMNVYFFCQMSSHDRNDYHDQVVYSFVHTPTPSINHLISVK